LDLSDDEDDPPVPPPDESTQPPMLATTDNSSVKTFGTVFGCGLEPVAAEEAAALPVDSVSPVVAGISVYLEGLIEIGIR